MVAGRFRTIPPLTQRRVKDGAPGFLIGRVGVEVDLVIGVIDFEYGVAEEEGVGVGFGVGGHGEAFDFGVVAGYGGLAGEDGGAFGGGAFEADDGEVGGVDPHFAIEEMGALAEGFEGDEDALEAVDFGGAGLRGDFVVLGGDEGAFAVGGEVELFFTG